MQEYTAQSFQTDVNQPIVFHGGYSKVFICSDNEPLCYKCANDNKDLIIKALTSGFCFDEWFIVGTFVNWENEYMYCCNCNNTIEPEYK